MRTPFSALRYFSLILILIAVILVTIQLVAFSRVRAKLPARLIIAGIDVGALDRQEAGNILSRNYAQPVELRYKDSSIQLNPSIVDFTLNIDSMLSLADYERTTKPFWLDFWDFLWGRKVDERNVPLSASYSEERLRAFLEDVTNRYDQPSRPAMPIPGTVSFNPGESGTELDVDASISLIESALYSLSNRVIQLPLKKVDPVRPPFQNLEILLKQTLDVAGFDGLAGIYLLDLRTGQEIHFGYRQGEDVSVQPDIPFTASSIIKIPIMVSAYIRMDENPDPETIKLLEDMIDKSGNEAADWFMDRVIDPDRAPLMVTEDMKQLGLENTFLAGYFTFGSPLLAVIETPANSRLDINTDPDPYNQTTPSEIGMLLEDLYQCSENGGSALVAVYPKQLSQLKCRAMVSYLVKNRLPVLLTAGIPEGTQIAHKHGWVTTNGVIKTIGDAGIIFTPNGNYIFVVFLYHPDQLVWEPASKLVSDLSSAVYNFYNLPAQ